MDKNSYFFNCQFELGMGVHYHMRRQAFYDNWHRMTGVLSLVFATSAVAVITSTLELGTVLTAALAVIQCIDLIVDTRGKATLHNELRTKYLMLEHELLGYGKNLNEDQYNHILMQIKTIELHEPQVRRLLLEICRNDVCRRLNVDNDQLISISWIKRTTANLFNWSSAIQAA